MTTARLFRVLLVNLLVLLWFALCCKAADKPNIVLILADDLGYGDVGCYNRESKVSTPHVDRLAQQGMRFTDSHSPSTVCTPTRYSIMTGRMAFRLNYAGLFTGVGGPCLITKDRLTLPGMLRDQGYETAMFGKWHIGMSFLDKNGDVIDDKEPPKDADRSVKANRGVDAVRRVDYSRGIPDGPIHRGFDHIVGRLLEKIESLGIADNTLVIVTSDNGPEVGTVLNMRSKYQRDGARPWRGMKRDNWEGGHRVPLVVRWPGRVKANSVVDQTVCLTDIMATCAEIVDANLPGDSAEDSVSVLPVLLGETDEEVRVVTLHQTISLALAIRKGKWKYLDHKGSGGNNYGGGKLKNLYARPETAPNAPAQLYDLENDPGETTNLYFRHPEIVKELKQQLDESKKSGRSAPRKAVNR